MMATILITHGVPDTGIDMLAGHRVLMPAPLEAYTREELLALIPQADAVLAAGRLDGDVICAGKKLKVIANYGAGYDSVDIAAAAACGVPVCNIPEQVADSTAELAIGLMLAASRRIGEMTLRLRHAPSNTLFGMGRHMGRNLRGQTLGILGMGRIGGRVAVMARALGMHVIGYSRRGVDETLAENVTLDEVLQRSDVLSIHCPLTEESRGMVDAAFMAKMKPGSILINTARGAIVDHEALADALCSGQIFAAGLDVYPEEPQVPARLLELPQCVMTPHVGSNAAETREAMLRANCQQILDVLAGKRPENIVNGL